MKNKCYKCHKNTPEIPMGLCWECLTNERERLNTVHPVGGESCGEEYENWLFEYMRFSHQDSRSINYNSSGGGHRVIKKPGLLGG